MSKFHGKCPESVMLTKKSNSKPMCNKASQTEEDKLGGGDKCVHIEEKCDEIGPQLEASPISRVNVNKWQSYNPTTTVVHSSLTPEYEGRT